MEETILVGDDLMMGSSCPVIPPDITSHVLESVDLCDGVFEEDILVQVNNWCTVLSLQINKIEPFCQDEIYLYRQCVENRDKELRLRLQDSEHRLGVSIPLDEGKDRATPLQSKVTSLKRQLTFNFAVNYCKWHGRVLPKMEFSWSPYYAPSLT
ncbi:hypothetical protein GIB67_029443 [Kingdonia uniflora]|uniref:DUF7803 domain-containing protein n=1 Tax=Kingdonia uniflora TaxID=39325 RepID=A0A7J7NXW2_9MAGN|nr:hypothetical protein GIB67_029443 [Kingdonia uniflora]